MMYVVCGLCILVFWEFWTFLLLAYPLRLFHLKMGRILLNEMINEESPIKGKKEDSAPRHHESVTQKIKDFLFFVISGYSKFLMVRIGYFPSHDVRNMVYKYLYLVDKDFTATIYYGAIIRGGGNLHIGRHSIVGDECMLDARRGGIFIGENVNIGVKVSFWTGSHDMNDPLFRSMPEKRGSITVGDRAWIGPHAVILKRVRIGEGAVVAAGAVVTKDVEPYSVVAGVPAKKVGERNRDLIYELDGSSFFY